MNISYYLKVYATTFILGLYSFQVLAKNSVQDILGIENRFHFRNAKIVIPSVSENGIFITKTTANAKIEIEYYDDNTLERTLVEIPIVLRTTKWGFIFKYGNTEFNQNIQIKNLKGKALQNAIGKYAGREVSLAVLAKASLLFSVKIDRESGIYLTQLPGLGMAGVDLSLAGTRHFISLSPDHSNVSVKAWKNNNWDTWSDDISCKDILTASF